MVYIHVIKTPRLLEASEYSSELYLDSHYSPQSIQEPSILQDFRVSQRKVHFPIELDYHPKYEVETEKPGCRGGGGGSHHLGMFFCQLFRALR